MTALNGSIQILTKTNADLIALGSPYIPLAGQPIKVSDTGMFCIGDGVTTYTALPKIPFAMSFIPLSGTTVGNDLTGQITVNTPGATALFANGTSFYIGAGDNSNFPTATSYSYVKFGSSQQVDIVAGDSTRNGILRIETASLSFTGYGATYNTQFAINEQEALISSTYTLFKGLQYSSINTANFVSLSLIHKGYADGRYAPISIVGTVTNIATGTGLTGGPITSTGTIALSTPLAPLASLAGNALKYLRVNAGETAVEYATVATSSPGGSNTQLQYNNAGAFGGITGATTNGTTLTLVAPILGTPASVTLTNATGLPLTTGVTGLLPLSNGGTNKNMTAANGGVVWTDADSMEVTAAGSSGQILRSAGAAAPVWSTATYPSTATGTGKILRADGTNWVETTNTYPNTTSANQVLRATSANVIGSDSTFTYDGTNLAIIAGVGSNRGVSFNNPAAGLADNLGALAIVPPTGTNVGMSLQVIPKGTGFVSTLRAQMSIFNTDFVADSANYEGITVRAAGTNGYGIMAVKGGTGTIRSIFIDATNGATPATANIFFATNGNVGVKGVTSPTASLHLPAGTATVNTAPLKFNTGTNLTTAEAGGMEYNNTFHLTNSDAVRRHIVLAPNTTKVTAAAPYTNDGYVVVNIGGTDFKLMTTA